MSENAPAFQPIEVTPDHADAGAFQVLSLQISEKLRQLRESESRIPGDAKEIDLIARELAKAVQVAVGRPDASAATLAKRLHAVKIRGLGQANKLWPRLFAMVDPSAVLSERLSIPGATRPELIRFLRRLFADQFHGRTQQLEWIIASVLAWRPCNLSELHGLFKKTDPFFLGIEAFERQYGRSFSFGPSNSRSIDPAPQSDWTRLWELEGQTGYGQAYPEEVRRFVESFLTDLRDQDPEASVLDVGTGNHAATVIARSISPGFRLVGIDIANLQAPPADARIETFRMNAAALGFSDMEFTAVISVNGIEYADRNLAYAEMYRVMRLGGGGALVLHRPDSHILRTSREFIALLDDTRLLETLAMSWMFVSEPTEGAFREIDMQLSKLMKKTVAPEFERYYRAVLKGIPEAIRGMRADPGMAFQAIERFETDLRWRHERDRFMLAHMATIPVDRNNLVVSIERHGFVVDAVVDLSMEAAGGRSLVGWGVRLHRPKSIGEAPASGPRD